MVGSTRFNTATLRGDTLVLCYHAVSDQWDSSLAVTTAGLEQQLSILTERGYRGVTFEDAVSKQSQEPRVAITFDDGYLSVFEKGKPILDRFDMPATVFLPTKFGDGGTPMSWPGIDHWLETPARDELVPFDWSIARQLVEDGWEIGSHTVSHPRLTQLSDNDLQRELQESRQKCQEAIGISCHSIAYPYGDTNARVASAARDAGYRYGATLPTDAWPRNPGPLLVSRVGVYRSDSPTVFKRKISRGMRQFRRSRIWPAVAQTWRRFRYR